MNDANEANAHDTEPTSSPQGEGRRSFLAATLGALASFGPLMVGLVVFLDPLRRRKAEGKLVRVATLSAVPADGQPYRFPVIATRTDAWSRHKPEPIGSVYIRRTSDDGTLEAFSSICPHLGCSVDFRPRADRFLCPCHNSAFNLDGSRVDPERSPSPRDLDTLDVEIRGDEEIWVDYRRFVGGKSEKIEE